MKPDQSDRFPARFLGDYLYSDAPSRLLVAGQLPAALLSRPVDGVAVHRFASLADAEKHALQSAESGELDNDADPPCTLVLQLDADKPEFERRLGRAIRAFPHRVLVHCAHRQDGSLDDTDPADERFFALGFRKLQLIVDDAQAHDVAPARWFEYRLSHYKISPNWLNARFWANPERFNEDEDPDIYCDDDDE